MILSPQIYQNKFFTYFAKVLGISAEERNRLQLAKDSLDHIVYDSQLSYTNYKLQDIANAIDVRFDQAKQKV